MATVGERIKKLRLDNNMSQVEFATKFGLSKQTLYKYENNLITNIPSDKIEEIAKGFGISPARLMGWDEKHDDDTAYYLDDEAKELAQFLFENPDYRVLFDAARNVKKEDLMFVKEFIDRFSK